jgi:hypothetical protein|tara:strand:+ start:3629 stop:3793 length:165 start_codon:yes stop_codon:yes gene_type:complete
MASGDLTCSTPTFAKSGAEIDTQISALNLAAVTDHLFVVPHNNGFMVFKAQREA